MSVSTHDIDLNRLRQAVGTLREYFDAVEIFATRTDDSGHNTTHCNYGAGNWFARYGHIKSFVKDTEKEYILGNTNIDNTENEWEK